MPSPPPPSRRGAADTLAAVRDGAANVAMAILSLAIVLYLAAGAVYALAPRFSGQRCELTVNSRIVAHHEGPLQVALQWVLWPMAVGDDLREARARGVSLSQVRWDHVCPQTQALASPPASRLTRWTEAEETRP